MTLVCYVITRKHFMLAASFALARCRKQIQKTLSAVHVTIVQNRKPHQISYAFVSDHNFHIGTNETMSKLVIEVIKIRKTERPSTRCHEPED